MSNVRSGTPLRRSLLFTFLAVAPMMFMGAECGADVFPNPPLADNSMRADVTVETSFASTQVSVSDKGSYWEVTADDEASSRPQTVVLDIPKRTDVPYTINVANEPNALIWYCVTLTSNRCKDFKASDAEGTGSITITKVGTALEGTFRGTLRSTDGDETRIISNGEFKVDL